MIPRRRKQPPDPPPPPTDPLLDLAMTWRGRAANLTVANLRLGTSPTTRMFNTARADTWMTAARELEAAVRKS